VSKEQNDIDELITRSLAGETTAEEGKNLSAWIALAEKNKEHYEKLKRVFLLGDSYYKKAKQPEPALNIDQEWNHFLKQIDAGHKDNVRTLNSPAKTYSMWMRVAAALLLVVVSGFIVNYFISTNKTTVIETADAMQEITLPDGSRVMLNKNSQLSYTPDFGKESRHVSLKGEAFFDVARDLQKPFIISASEATVEVLGTSFNLQAYDAKKLLEVVVATGTVKLSVPNVKQEVTLQAGDRGVYAHSEKQLTQITNTDINFLAWKTRKLIFMETDLNTVIETINQAYQTNITIEAKVPATCLVTVTFDQQNLEAVLNVLKTTLNLTYKTDNGTIIITDAGC
jgi:transmembrane sensor